ncbi:predicted protein [Sclerotinia sclerotiorum 1980 UF-70]|uniref:Uncharacterized protein n=1 Tax=Sclerotinia sclerotiorum (strain ATCC 18683 / 1980 / Ss-1) TaxID=665079 RepID=A7ENR4_SCLS1|nr:predicted protein [Sclerotinia sclerotiorum 1980 UF-70]EDO04480.1 predicted protein [Sclerotinia sclerotiorum 1980 UF-70]
MPIWLSHESQLLKSYKGGLACLSIHIHIHAIKAQQWKRSPKILNPTHISSAGWENGGTVEEGNPGLRKFMN